MDTDGGYKFEKLWLCHKRQDRALDWSYLGLEAKEGSLLVSSVEVMLKKSENDSSESECGLNNGRGEWLFLDVDSLNLEFLRG